MAKRYGSTFSGVLDGTKPAAQANGARGGGKKRTIVEIFDLSSATFANGDTLSCGKRPQNSYFAGGRITSSVSLGSSTLSIGSAASAAKYRAAATFTTADQAVTFGKASALAEAALAADEEVIATIGTADLPASGTLIIETDYLVSA